MWRHNYRLQGWEDTLMGAVVDTRWICIHCQDEKLHVTPVEWEAECPGPSKEMLEALAIEAERRGDTDKLEQKETE